MGISLYNIAYKFEQSIKKHPFFLFILYTVITLILYRNTYNAGMVFDFNGWAARYEQGTFIDTLKGFGYPGLHQVEQIVFYSLYKLFGFNGLYWYIAFSLLHAFTAVVAYFLILKLLENFQSTKYNFQIAFFTSLLFLLSAYAPDTVVSKVTVHYFICSILMMASVLWLIKYITTQKILSLLFALLFFELSLFSLELSYALPIFITILYLYLLLGKNKYRLSIWIVILYFALLAAHLVLHKILIGSFIGHYGSSVHTRVVMPELLSNFYYYFNGYVFLL
ncbi:MAG: hypothetical protein LRY27_00205 [Chitinophagales bacterium]|nr:hypothetical protein [Chitinophagales bacterium]